MSKKEEMQKNGACIYCGQVQMITEDELLDAVASGIKPEEAADVCATRKCSCRDAEMERERQMRLEAAGEWAKNTFSDEEIPERLAVALCAISATFCHAVDYVTFRIGKYTHKVDKDKDGMIRIRSRFTEENEETF